jgi:tetratricopeptide (TPR) repeat protein
MRRATFHGWLLLLPAVSILVPWLAPAPLAAADTPAEQQLDFGADMARRGLWKEALFRFQQADQLDPDNPRILNNIAVSYEALGLFDEALESYQRALRVGPEDRELRGNYSRFAEFYQSFRPREPGDQAAADGEATSAEAGGEGSDGDDPETDPR